MALVIDSAFSVSLASASPRDNSNVKLDSWQVRLHSDLEACAALQMSLIDRFWKIFCATCEGRHGKRAWDSAGEHIVVMVFECT